MARTRPSKPNVTIEEITPVKATKYLDKTLINRTVRPSLVARFAEVMMNGGWHLNGETIKFDSEGNLIDGQHRLMAVEEAGVSIEFVVVRGVQAKTRSSIDIGARRTLADWLKMNGESDVNNLSTAINWYYRLSMVEDPRIKQSAYPTYETSLEILHTNPGLRQTAHDWRSKLIDLTGRTGLIVALFYWFDSFDPHARKEFADRLYEGAGLERGDPILVLRRVLMKDRNDRYSRGNNNVGVTLAAVTIKAFNYWRVGRQVTLLSWRPATEPFPAPLTAKEVAAIRAGKAELVE